MTYKILALGGGGTKGILHVGAIKVLEEKGKLIELFSNGIYGCSVGSLYATGIAFGLNSIQIENMSAKFSSFNDTFFGNLSLNGLTSCLIKKGLFEMDLFEDFIVKTFLDENIDLRNKKISDALIPLKICATNITKKELTIFQGNFPVIKALRASCCIPLIFCPQEINGTLYIDGGYLTNIISLDLSNCELISDIGISHISSLTNIKKLNLDDCEHISDVLLAFLSKK
jgi:NTE family protein